MLRLLFAGQEVVEVAFRLPSGPLVTATSLTNAVAQLHQPMQAQPNPAPVAHLVQALAAAPTLLPHGLPRPKHMSPCGRFVGALAHAPSLKVLHAHMPAVWNTALLEVLLPLALYASRADTHSHRSPRTQPSAPSSSRRTRHKADHPSSSPPRASIRGCMRSSRPASPLTLCHSSVRANSCAWPMPARRCWRSRGRRCLRIHHSRTWPLGVCVRTRRSRRLSVVGLGCRINCRSRPRLA